MSTLIRFELKKMVNRRIIWVLLLIVTAFAVYNFAGTFRYAVYDGELHRLTGLAAIAYDRDLQNRHAGQYSDEETIEIERQGYEIMDNPDNRRDAAVKSKMPNRTPLTDEFYFKEVRQYEALWYGAINQNDFTRFIFPTLKSGDLTNLYHSANVRFFRFHDNWIPAPDANSPEAAKLLSMYEKVERPLTIEFLTGMDELLNSLVSILIFPVMAILIVCLAPVFSEEYGAKTAPVVLTTKYGRSKLIKSKLIASYLFATGLFLAAVLLYAGFYLSCYGFSGMAASIQVSPYFHVSPYNFKMWQLLLAVLGMGYLGFLFATGAALLISAKAKNAYNALIPLAAITYLPLIDLSGVSVTLEKVLLFFPANMVEATEMFRFPVFYDIGGILLGRVALSAVSAAAAVIVLSALAARAFRNYQAGS